MKNKMNGAKPVVNFMPNNHGIPRRPVMPDQDFSTPRIPDLKAGGSGTAVPSNRKTIPDFRNGNRRDSMSSMSTGLDGDLLGWILFQGNVLFNTFFIMICLTEYFVVIFV